MTTNTDTQPDQEISEKLERLELYEEHDRRRKSILSEIDAAEMKYEASKKETKALKDDLENWHQALIAHDRTEPGQSSLFGPASESADDNTPANSTAYHEGIAARREGLELDACPYDPGDEKWCWLRGYEWEQKREAGTVESRTIDMPEGLDAEQLSIRCGRTDKLSWKLGPPSVQAKDAITIDDRPHLVVDEIMDTSPLDDSQTEVVGYWLAPTYSLEEWEAVHWASIGDPVTQCEDASPYHEDGGHGLLAGLQIKLGRSNAVIGPASEYLRVMI